MTTPGHRPEVNVPPATQPPLVLLGVTGSIAAYKSVELLRQLIARGDLNVRVLMTPAAEHFVGALTFEALSGAPVYRDPLSWQATASTQPATPGSSGIAHTDLTEQAALLVVAPATANSIAKLAHGLGDDAVAVSALALRSGVPILVAPAMNPRMWNSPAVQANIETLRFRGVSIIGPGTGAMACGDTGEGRMVEPDEIAAQVRRALAIARNPSGKTGASRRVLVLSGPTREAIDDVRFLSNGSSGRMGAALAAAAFERGDDVHVITGPAAVLPPRWVRTTHVESAAQMLDAALAYPCDLLLSPAAVADHRPAQRQAGKPSKEGATTLNLEPNPDILAALAASDLYRREGSILVAFAAEESLDDVEKAIAKARKKGARAIVLNDASHTMGSEQASVRVVEIDHDQVTPLGPLPKNELARRILNLLEKRGILK